MKERKNEIVRIMATIALLLSMTMTSYAGVKYVTAPSGLNVRETPAGNKITAIPYGTSVETYGETDGWTVIKLNNAVCYVASQHLAEDEPKASAGYSLGVFQLTGYCTCKKCCGKWSPEVTGKEAWTASGTHPTLWRTVAVDPSVIPLGTWMEINLPGIGWTKFRAEDTGSGVNGKHIDIYAGGVAHSFPSWCNGKAEVRILY